MKKDTSSIPVVADVPSENPELGFDEFAKALAGVIRECNPPRFTIGIYGAWGSGKTSLLHAIERKLSKDNTVIPVFFNAWRYERSEHIVVPLLQAVHSKIKETGHKEISQNIGRVVKAIVFSLKFKLGFVEVDAGNFRKLWSDDKGAILDAAFFKPFKELEKIPKVLGGKRIVVLIDDLDRCSPGKVVSVLEAIKLILDVDGFIFVLAMDFDVLVASVEAKYPNISGGLFLQKLIQLPFRVPPIDVGAGYLTKLIKNWQQVKPFLPQSMQDIVRKIAKLGLYRNPRQIKRLVNSYLLLRNVINARKLEIDDELLLALIGIQLRWPLFYQKFQRLVWENFSEPLSVFTAASDTGLANYASQLLAKNYDSVMLRSIVDLTVVFEQDSANELLEGEDSLEKRKAMIVEYLKSKPFYNKASEKIYYIQGRPNARFKVKPKVLRYEEKQGDGKWRLLESYAYLSSFESAIETIRQISYE